jgi:hypothetical protein
MGKKALSVTLDELNLLWLRDQAIRKHARNISDAIDRLVTEARVRSWGPPRPSRSIVGTIEIPADDPDLEKAHAAVRGLFEQSLDQTTQMVREARTPYRRSRRKATRG